MLLGCWGAKSLDAWCLQQPAWRVAMSPDGQAGGMPGRFFWVLLGFSNNQHVLTKHFDFDKLVFLKIRKKPLTAYVSRVLCYLWIKNVVNQLKILILSHFLIMLSIIEHCSAFLRQKEKYKFFFFFLTLWWFYMRLVILWLNSLLLGPPLSCCCLTLWFLLFLPVVAYSIFGIIPEV